MNAVKQILIEHLKNKRILFNMSIRDFKSKYIGSYLGAIWAFVQPVTMVLIFWFIFQVGFKSAPVDDIPYILYFITSIIPWFFFSESVSSATNGVVDNSFLVKKVVFPVSILPGVKILSALYVHLVFVVFTFLILVMYEYSVNVQMIQVFYYMIATILLVLGISWMTSAIVIFFRDTAQIIAMMLQFGFWLTPIFWSLGMMPDKYHTIVKILPMYYIAEGYRNSLLYGRWFWEQDLYLTFTFWSITIFMLLVGAYLFKRLSSHFADVL
ncbi:ABC transporter permease [Paenibacillus harenae]|uniref:ABC transporter permease n=1 Tax=Paenibacillus harenae TaxID=306543 RepID=UPI0004041590|nr:ABC transporter permease [Paenibacillus harenae]